MIPGQRHGSNVFFGPPQCHLVKLYLRVNLWQVEVVQCAQRVQDVCCVGFTCLSGPYGLGDEVPPQPLGLGP